MLPLACLLRMSDLGQLGPIRAKKKIKVAQFEGYYCHRRY